MHSLFFFFFFFCKTSNLVMSLKQLTVSTEHGVKNPFGIEQYIIDFRSSMVGIKILKVKGEEDIHLQLTSISENTWWIKPMSKNQRNVSGNWCQYFHNISSRKLARWRNSINEFHMNSVKVKWLKVLKCFRCCFLIKWLVMKNEAFMTILND